MRGDRSAHNLGISIVRPRTVGESTCWCHMRANYRIYIRGRLGPELQAALADLRPESCGRHTQLSVDAADQAALFGALGRLRGLALEVDSLWRTGVEPT